MKRAAIAILAGLLCSGSLTVQADSSNPFGFQTNKHPLTYGYCKITDNEFSHFWYECRSAPRMHPDMKIIRLKFVDDVGLCVIAGESFKINETITLDSFKEQIAETYGPPTSQEEFREHTIRYNWDRKAGFPGLSDIVSIFAKTTTWDGVHRVQIFFMLSTGNECRKAIDKKRAEAF